jgi:hypothetical protein
LQPEAGREAKKMKEWLLAPGRLKVTSQENIFHECLAVGMLKLKSSIK